MFLNTLIFFIALVINSSVGFGDLEEGDICEPTQNIADGMCKLVTKCEDAMRFINKREHHPFNRCGFSGSIEIVCCPKSSFATTTTRTPVKTTRKPTPIDRSGGESSRIAHKKCREIVENSIPPLNLHIIGGVDAQLGEFPHMVALGYLKGDEYDFSCGGSLISDTFVLTAAHCVDNIQQITPSIVRLGVVDIGKNVFDSKTDINIAEIIKHPSYTSLQKYHDLALLRLAKAAETTFYVVPACLYTGEAIPNVALTVTGWGKISTIKDIRGTTLQKANVTEVDNSLCDKGYINWRKLPNGIGQGQFCAGDPLGRTDSCQGDSGGPLQGLTSMDGHYRVIGITSFGRGCGSSIPGVYTRVFSYLDWIESVVWPSTA